MLWKFRRRRLDAEAVREEFTAMAQRMRGANLFEVLGVGPPHDLKMPEIVEDLMELTDPIEQRRRFEDDQRHRRDAKAPVYPIDERFLEALEKGMPSSGGNALGVDRLLMLLLGADSIQSVMTFPLERL